MGRVKGGKNKSWTAQQKLEVITPVLKGEISMEALAKNLGYKSAGIICNWVKSYNNGGLEALENKRKHGNPLSKYQNRKELTELEKLQYENMKLRIENERLKKGYTTEEADLAKQKK